MEENTNPQNSNSHQNSSENHAPEPEKKASVFSLIIGAILIVRGIMRINEKGGMEIFGIIMVVIGLVSIGLFFRNRF